LAKKRMEVGGKALCSARRRYMRYATPAIHESASIIYHDIHLEMNGTYILMIEWYRRFIDICQQWFRDL